MNHQREFYVVIERDEDGYYVGEVPQLRGCYSQGETIDELMKNIREVIELCLEDDNPEDVWEFVGIQNPNRNNFYHPLVSKSAYSGKRIEGLTENYFEGSYANVVSFLVDKKQMSIEDLELLLQQLKNKQND